jgi:hypothetical protein
MIVYIVNNVTWHFEILESVIVKYKEIVQTQESCTLYIKIKDKEGIKAYLQKKFKDLIFGTPDNFDYYIDCTLDPSFYPTILIKDPKKFFFICHNLNNELKRVSNILAITPLGNRWFYADILPTIQKRNVAEPVYVIQGNFIEGRRNFDLLEKILMETHEYPFKIKIIGRDIDYNFVNKWKDRFIIKQGLFFEEYHREFEDVYCILPLILKKTHPAYYSTKLTSSINYARAYGLKCIIDKDLQTIYNLSDAEVFEDENIVDAFKKTLSDFYRDAIILHAKTE